MKKNSLFTSTGFLIGVLVLSCVVIVSLYFKIQNLEYAKKQLMPGTIKTLGGNLLLPTQNDYMQGNKNAPITIIEYSDFECPSCQTTHPVLQKIMKTYANKVRLVARMFPLPQNKNAEKEEEAALCAGSIGGNDVFWKYGDAIYSQAKGTEDGTGFPLQKLMPLAKEFHLDEKQFTQCLNSGQYASRVSEEKKSGEAAGVNALPAFFVIDPKGNSLVIAGLQSFETLKVIIDEALSHA